MLDDGGEARDDRVRSSYDSVAGGYADKLATELVDGGLPFETWLLDRVAAHADGGPVVEVGCGPGHVTAYLAEAGADAFGIDLSPAMVDEARRRFPEGSYEVGDLRSLMRPPTAPGWRAVLGWYSLIHLAASELPAAIDALARTARRRRLLVLAMHAGTARTAHRRVVRPRRSISTSSCTSRPTSPRWSRRPDWSRSSGTAAGPLAHRGETTERLYVIARLP